jgi:uncharacterized protein
MPFLTAEWRKLALANYAVDERVLEKYVPYGTELERFCGTCYVSLVGFMFLNTRVLGIRVPLHVEFEEVNLRFYVRYKEADIWKRGVVFIKELVPRAALTFVANSLYKEHYQTVPMGHSWQSTDEELQVEYNWQLGGRRHSISVVADPVAGEIPAACEAEFITEHYWGYTRIGPEKTFEYEVTHPRWLVYPVRSHRIDADFGMIYGKDFAFLNGEEPVSVMLAEGSEITVERKRVVR